MLHHRESAGQRSGEQKAIDRRLTRAAPYTFSAANCQQEGDERNDEQTKCERRRDRGRHIQLAHG